MRIIRVVWTIILVLMVPLALLTTGFTAPVKACFDSPVIEWTKNISARAVIQTGDGGYAVVTDEGGDFCLEKFDSSGNTQWNRTHGGPNDDQAHCLVETNDGGYAIAGSTSSFGAGGYDFWLVKTDSNGHMQWNKTFGGTDNDFAQRVIQTSDRGYIMFGSYIVKTDYLGNEEWNRTYNGSSIVEIEDGGYMILGESGMYDEAKVTKIDAYGNTEWNKTLDVPAYYYHGSLVQTDDGGFAIAGTSGNYGPGGHSGFLLKADSAGNKEWSRTYVNPYIYAGVQTTDGGYALAGESPWLIKTDNVGDMQWQMTGDGWPYLSGAHYLVQTEDGGYVVACSSSFPAHSCLVKVSPFPRHNIAITQVIALLFQVQVGDILPINVTILNDGNYNETANVILYDGLIQIDSQTIIIQTGASETLTFLWNTTGAELGQHNILANATIAGETYLVDNIGQITGSIMDGSKISLNTVSSVSSVVGFYVNISGTLTDNRGNVISGGLVFLAYQWLGDVMWYEFASVQSETNGYYSAIWIPTARGNFTLKVKWNGNTTHFGTSNSTTLTVNPTHTIYMSLSSSTSFVGFQVEINGILTSGGVGLSGTLVHLSYSATSGESWNDIIVINTTSGGDYSAVWIPTATGHYLVRATWAGDPIYPRTSTTVNLAVISYQEQNVFSVASNSTVSELAFNSTSRELSFTVTGPSGTTGYVNVYLTKALIENIVDVKVYLDGDKLNCTATSLDDSWLLHFTYQHSTHKVTITLGAISTFIETPLGKAIIYGVALMAMAMFAIIYILKKRQ